MSASFELNAEPRNDMGKGASRRLRRSGRVPAIIYGGTEAPVSISLEHNELLRNLENEAFYSHILTVKLNGGVQQAVLRDMQRHPSKPHITHVDLQRVSEREAIRVHVPLHFLGEEVAPGVKTGGGMISHEVIEAEVECLPKDLPEFIEVDLSHMNLGDSIHLSDLKLPERVSLVELQRGEDHDYVVASIHARKAEAASEDEEEEVAEGGEDEA